MQCLRIWRAHWACATLQAVGAGAARERAWLLDHAGEGHGEGGTRLRLRFKLAGVVTASRLLGYFGSADWAVPVYLRVFLFFYSGVFQASLALETRSTLRAFPGQPHAVRGHDPGRGAGPGRGTYTGKLARGRATLSIHNAW